jgi:uncharacterized protein YndB with AHSA1/START domain
MATHELTLTRVQDAPAGRLFRCRTDSAVLKQRFAPKPYSVSSAELDVRSGGPNNVTVRSPDCQDTPIPGQYDSIRAGASAPTRSKPWQRQSRRQQ